jgi:hypothetical protein
MRRREVDFDVVRALGRELPDLQESTMYGSPALKLGKRLVACLAIHRSVEPGSLIVRTDFEQREALLSDDPETYYVTEHYTKHPVVLVRMGRLQRDQLRDLLASARQCVLAHAERGRKKASSAWQKPPASKTQAKAPAPPMLDQQFAESGGAGIQPAGVLPHAARARRGAQAGSR